MSNQEIKRVRFDSDCYVVDWSENELSEQMSELSEMSYGTDIERLESGTESGSDAESSSSSEGIMDVTSSTVTETSDEEVNDFPREDGGFGPEVPERIIWGKPMFSRRVLQVRRGAERAWRLRQAARTVNWKAITQGKGYQLVKAACKEVQRKLKMV